MTDSVQSYDFSQQARNRRPRVRTGLIVFAAAFAVLCISGIVFREPLFDYVGSFLVPEPPPDINPDDVVPAGLTEDERLMYTLSEAGGQAAKDAAAAMATTNDQKYVPVLLEALISAEESPPGHARIGLHHYFKALMKLIGGPSLAPESVQQALSQNFLTWYTSSDVTSPDGFTGWKGRLLARIDPTFGELITEGVPTTIRIEEVRAVKEGFDTVPTLDDPEMVPAAEAAYLTPEDPVFGVEWGGEARAYPERILQWHGVVNDVIAGVPVTIAYCRNSGLIAAYDGRGSDGTVYTFGSAGLFYRGNGLLFDRETRTVWSSLTGRPLIGKGVASDVRLTLLPFVVTSWDQWRSQHPETTVLQVKDNSERPYELAAAHGPYIVSDKPARSYGPRDDRLPLKSRVYGLSLGDAAKAYPLAALASQQVVNDTVGGQPLVLVSARGTVPVHATLLVEFQRGRTDPYEIDYDAGAEVRVFSRSDRTFGPGPNPDTLLDGEGRSWKVTPASLVAENGEELPRVNGVESYWFAWSQYYVGTEVYGAAQQGDALSESSK